MNLSTCQLVFVQTKLLQIRQFDDIGRNWPYTKSRQNSEKREMVNWFTMVLFDVEIRLQEHWEKLRIYRPVSLFSFSQSFCKFVNLTTSGGIGPIQSQDKTAKKGRWWTALNLTGARTFIQIPTLNLTRTRTFTLTPTLNLTGSRTSPLHQLSTSTP